ncbi:MAG: DUF692 domain-containing protein [Proteobacteria bacterium]|nr:DUF692 domain-containing protein [Pseudomonadota bacterium]
MKPCIPVRAGAGFKSVHYDEILNGDHAAGWFEVHAENYMGEGGRPHEMLERLRADYPLSFHGVGLSIGSADGIDTTHLSRLKNLCDRYQPNIFSEHLAWSSHGDSFFNDLLPLPYTKETLSLVVSHIDQIQTSLGRQLLLENPSAYLTFEENSFTEVEFLNQVACRTGCGLLLDVNNVFVSANNLGFDAQHYLTEFPVEKVGEIHLAGFSKDQDSSDESLLVDAHDRAPAEAIWRLFMSLVGRIGPVPTLIEWDNNIPSWIELNAEVQKAGQILDAAFPLGEVANV